MYEDFASVYDMLMDDFDYDAWSGYYLDLIRSVTGELPRRAAETEYGGKAIPRFPFHAAVRRSAAVDCHLIP